MSFARVVILLILLAVSAVGPGIFLSRRWRLGALERFCAGVGLSLFILYLCAWVIYWFDLPVAANYAVSFAAGVMLLASWRDVRRVTHRIRKTLAAYGIVLLWLAILLSLVRHYAGGTWSGDWLEHYQRTLFFLHGWPPDTLFLDQYPLPARPPMMNLLTAHFLAQVGDDYEHYQIVMLVLNSLAFVPCALLVRRFGGKGLAVMVALFAANPMFVQNSTYAWTKLFTAFYVVLGVALYLRGWRRNDAWRTIGAMASVAVGFIVHYSAGPYALAMWLHYGAVVLWQQRWREAALSAALSAAILATWLGWAGARYGAGGALASSSTITDSRVMSAGQNVINIAQNMLNTLVPRVVREPSILQERDLEQSSRLGNVRDFAFLVYQVSFPFALGSVGAVAVVYLLWRGGSAARWRSFWLVFVPVVFVAGVAVYGGRDRFGVAHICLQPIVLIGLIYLAARFGSLPLTLRWIVVAGLALDFVLGIFVHFTLQNRTFELTEQQGQWVVTWTADMLSPGAQYNFTLKQQTGVSYWADAFAGRLTSLQAVMVLMFGWLMWRMIREARLIRRTDRSAPKGSRSGSSCSGR